MNALIPLLVLISAALANGVRLRDSGTPASLQDYFHKKMCYCVAAEKGICTKLKCCGVYKYVPYRAVVKMCKYGACKFEAAASDSDGEVEGSGNIGEGVEGGEGEENSGSEEQGGEGNQGESEGNENNAGDSGEQSGSENSQDNKSKDNNGDSGNDTGGGNEKTIAGEDVMRQVEEVYKSE
eukprot:TRINITY_DN12757_c0_g8_i1.p1 TRINITY_DN12757_c0_g8~~TRINITY_DN12757_c0_g8_i1.p1  ORF type:complete len:181 (+),score=49.21 TRINITY_DN12757_c0_g8_i1:147-689(+)